MGYIRYTTELKLKWLRKCFTPTMKLCVAKKLFVIDRREFLFNKSES